MDLYSKTCMGCSKLFTTHYSTSFSKAVSMLHHSIQEPIYAIYGFVRLADEIVDTFHQHPKRELLAELKAQTYKSISERISTNPILNSFQLIVNQYKIPHELIESFLVSMEMDLEKQEYSTSEYKKYIYGSAEVVGLMCLKVFCNGNQQLFDELTAPARSLGEAFQKVNFLRDLKDDYEERGRVYFPDVDFSNFTEKSKRSIEQDIQNDLDKSLVGIKKLPAQAKLGVYLAYRYYGALLRRIKRTSASRIASQRIRVPDSVKFLIRIRSWIDVKLKLI
ncbi:MAG TPA: phytoene/squalene synthase family protein [Tenuifilaceae bacterium]|nr:phytoene/squalene synthase family protein [Tenuifilaceae bacterium]HPJ45686.1 phytoene/squalene synthase family protein [Tenuifilaceae bacterium]HPQ35786.1 phytoene/squalene synthase family protein [Tenuifilaceae bacterium]HRX68270.1 phytoene/squalene synthase family protein [Tenuifilaceae bacterium]